MQLKFTSNEPGSFFHFLDSISLWDIHTRENIKKYYEKRYPLSKKDKNLIQKYIKIRKKYPWKKLDSDFYTSKNFKETKSKLKKRLNKEEYKEISSIIENFYPNIHKIFISWKNRLIKRKEALQKESKQHKLRELFSEIALFYEAKNYPKEVIVHLVINPYENLGGGGANILPRKHITIEPSNLKTNKESDLKHDISVITHETLHLIENKANKNKWKNFEKLSVKNKTNLNILSESIADTLVPSGYLALKHNLVKKIWIKKYSRLKVISRYKKSSPNKYYLKSRRKLSAMIYLLTKKQIEKEKTIFEDNYLEKCIEKYILMREKT